MTETSCSRADGKALRILGIGGYSCFTGWFLIAAFNVAPHFFTEPAEGESLLPCVLFFAGMAVFTVALKILAAKFEDTYLSTASVCIATALCAAFAACPSLLQQGGLLGFSAFGALAFLAGCCAVYFFFAWDDFGGRSKTGEFVRYLAAALCLGNALFLFCTLFISSEARSIFSLGLIILSGFLLTVVDELSKPLKEQSELDAALKRTENDEPLDKRISVLFSLFCLAFGLSWALFLINYPDKVLWVFLASGAASIALIFLIRKDAVIHDRYVTTLIRACVAVLGVSSLFLVPFNGQGAQLFLVVICASWQLFWIVDASLLMRHAAKYGFSIPRHTAAGRTGSNMGFAAGMAIGIVGATLLGQLAYTAFGFTIAAAMVVSSMLLFPFENRRSPDTLSTAAEPEPVPEATPLPLPSSIQEACASAAKLYGLSQREEEILQLIVKGRNNRVIAESLFISENTAKTHVYNIYKKMGVHSRQQVLDTIELLSQTPGQP